jgi:hypothetical protein
LVSASNGAVIFFGTIILLLPIGRGAMNTPRLLKLR